MKALFPEVTNIGYSEMDFVSNNDSLNIIPTFIVEASANKIDNNKIKKWIKLMSHSDSYLVIIRSLQK